MEIDNEELVAGREWKRTMAPVLGDLAELLLTGALTESVR